MSIAAWSVLLIFFCFYWGQKLLATSIRSLRPVTLLTTIIIPLLMGYAIYTEFLIGVMIIVAFEMILNFLVSVRKEKEIVHNFIVTLLAFALNAGVALGAYLLVQSLR